MRLSVEVLKPKSQGLKKCSPKLEGSKIIQDLNHTLLLLYLPSPESRSTGFKLFTWVPTVNELNGKKKPSAGRAAPRCVKPWEEVLNQGGDEARSPHEDSGPGP